MNNRIKFTVIGGLAVATFFVIIGIALSPIKFPSARNVAGVSDGIYYVSLTGDDNNDGSAQGHFRTFAKAISVLQPGNTLRIGAGIYSERLNINRSGAPGAPIHITNVADNIVVIDLGNASDKGVLIPAGVSHVKVDNVEVRNSTGYCASFSGNNLEVAGLTLHHCNDMGLYIDGQNINAHSNIVHHASMVNSGRNMGSGWGSGIKLRVGANNVTVANNTVYNNYGEGIAVTRATNTIVRGNRVYDNYAVQIYVDNSVNTTVERNFGTCSGSSGFEDLDGDRPNGIAIGEEQYSGWGAQLSGVFIRNNIINGCHTGVTRFTSNVGGGLDNSIITFNTLLGITKTAIGIEHDAGNSGIQIRNNITSFVGSGKHCYIENNAGITLSNNFWIDSNATSNCRGSGDKFGGIAFATTPNLSSASSYKLSASSPAIQSGAYISSVTTDYANAGRGNPPDMGAWEFIAVVPTTTAPPPTTTSVETTTSVATSAPVSVATTTSVTASTAVSVATTTTIPVAGNLSTTSASQSLSPSQIVSQRIDIVPPGEVQGVNSVCNADYNGDGEITSADFGIFAQNYEQAGINCSLDLRDGNCKLDINDFEIFARAYYGEKVCRL